MPFPESVPILTDGVVRLRAHRERDIDRIVEQCRDPQSLRWTTVPRHYTPEMAHEWLSKIRHGWDSSSGDRLWAIEEVADPGHSFFGTIDLRPRAVRRAEIGFGLHPSGRGRGLMARALKLVCQWWWQQDGRRVDWYAERGNFSSWAVARSCGFDFVATLPGHVADGDGAPADAWFATLGRDDVMHPRTPWMQPPVMAAGSIGLRPWRDDDLVSVEAPEHAAHFTPSGAVPTVATWTNWLERRRLKMARGSSVNWAITDTAADRALGELLVFVRAGAIADGDTAEIGYFLYPSARGRGAAKTAVALGIQHAFALPADGGLGLRRLVAETASDNAASNAVLTSAGFTRWGHEAAASAPEPAGFIGPADHWELLASVD